jgi:hypothetical protein
MKLIESKTLATAAASIDFTSIPQDATDLAVLISARTNNGDVDDGVRLAFNGTTGNWSFRFLYGSGSSVSSGTAAFSLGSTRGWGGYATGATSTSNTFGNTLIYIPNYTASVAKSVSVDGVSENNATQVGLALVANLWNQTAAITSVELSPAVGSTFSIGSTASLYKITKGSDGIVTTSP